jgi:hypothetical protein
VINDVYTTEIVEHVVAMYSPYGDIGLTEVETLSVDLLFVNIDKKDARTHHYIKLSSHYQLLSPTFKDPLLLLSQ